MNRMRTTGSRKISDTFDSDAYALQRTAAAGGTSMLQEKDVELGRSRTSQTAHSPIGFPPDLCVTRCRSPKQWVIYFHQSVLP